MYLAQGWETAQAEMAVLRRELVGAKEHIKRLEGAARGKRNKGRLTTGPNTFHITQAQALSQLKDIEAAWEARKLRCLPRLPTPANAHVLKGLGGAASGSHNAHGNDDGFAGSDIEMFNPNDNDTDTETEANINKSDVFGPRLGNLGHF
jgi:hypothetical protein